ncbi:MULTISPECIES: SNF2-related protein [Moraxella]|uniref:Helicase Snf2/Rad54 family n=1 Tax=Moraxella catarrhalis TaxID=480 RepID=A0A7Z0UZ85_MORCA|nr:SNF2-related protein [Moraxella catarrhalis]OAV01432.1 helicase Snf2/Rad54 family [Moraxella catarrhalis]STY81673.1 RNA polymerase-associated protein rapA [Moraxella catarrhalis]
MNITPHQAKYFANAILCQSDNGVERITQGLFNAKVDLNPHQIDAAIFALHNPLDRGVLLADEVGLGKTIEAGLVLCQLWAERKRQLIIVCPAVLRKQWQNELVNKFGLPSIIFDKHMLKDFGNDEFKFLSGHIGKQIIITSHHYASKFADTLAGYYFDCVIIDEAHKLRNAHRNSNKMGRALKAAFQGRKKILLTATPLQNSLMELYGLSTLIDDEMFGDEKVFRREFINRQNNDELKNRLQAVVKRTLRKDVSEYIRYTKRHTITQNFYPSDDEQRLYESISEFIGQENTIALPRSQRHLIGLILRKLLASSPYAVADTLQIILNRLLALKKQQQTSDLLSQFDDIESDLVGEFDEWEDDDSSDDNSNGDLTNLNQEIAQIQSFINKTHELKNDSKAQSLLTALATGFDKMNELGAKQKVIIFTESVRTQSYLFDFLSNNGYRDKIVCFSGSSNSSKDNQAVYQKWLNNSDNKHKITGSKAVDVRTALIDEFEQTAQIMIATESASEGVNLQFCSLLINYDLPWNPQRVEQRIGRCHRYGQLFDVVVINFLNKRNEADQRILELLGEKFKLFDGVFGVSDEILGRIESGIDFEKRINQIYDKCRTSDEIKTAFDELQKELESQIQANLERAGSQILDYFDEDVQEKLKLQLSKSQSLLDKTSRYFWLATQFALNNKANFDEKNGSFYLHSPPKGFQAANYVLQAQNEQKGHDYRLHHPLGEYCLSVCQNAHTPIASLSFDYTNYHSKLSIIGQKQGQSGWLWVDKVGFYGEKQTHEEIVFTACTEQGEWLDDDFCQKLLSIQAQSDKPNKAFPENLTQNAKQAITALTARHSESQSILLKKESQRLDKWAEDKIKASEQEIADIDEKIKQIKRNKNQARNLEELAQIESELKNTERQRRRLRQSLFDVQDEIEEQRDELFSRIQSQLAQDTKVEHLFAIHWAIN